MSLFGDIFGEESWVTRSKPTSTSIAMVPVEVLIKNGSSLITHEGKLYRLTIEEMDTSGLKPKTANASDPANPGAPEAEKKQ
jgi:hypothetical protein